MSRHHSDRGFGNRRSFLGVRKAHISLFTVLLAVAVLGLGFGVPAHAADKLIVKNGSTTKFVVTDTGAVGAGVTEPSYPFDLSSQGNMESQMHFSLNGTDVGGWITSVLDNNFFVSSGAEYNSSAGGWIQKSSDGKSVMAGSGGSGYTLYMQSGTSVGGAISAVPRLKIDYSGNMTIPKLAGSYNNGSAYVCVNNSGQLYASETGCP
ncbi:MAG: hypothetical protein P8Z71_08970 [Candidatus Sulfobium sp.]